jgi:hypothetical protein
MNELFRQVGGTLTMVAGLAISAYTVKYAIDAWNGHYCLPTNSEYTVLRHMGSAANGLVNMGAYALDKRYCPSPPIFSAPPARSQNLGNGS